MKKLVIAGGIVAWFASGDWLIGACLLVLALGWFVLQSEEGPPVLALAYTLQWITVCIGLYYVTLTDRPLQATLSSDYRPMVIIGLGCLLALGAGLEIGRRLVRRFGGAPTGPRPAYALTFKTLVLCYLVASAATGVVHQKAWEYPALTQAIIALTYMRLGLLYLVLRRLVGDERWTVMAGVLSLEVVLGVTGFYAGFREPLMMAVLAFLEHFDRQNVRHWARLAMLSLAMVVLGVAWVSVRVNYRDRFSNDEVFAQDRSARFDSLSDATRVWAGKSEADLFNDMDQFVDRLWAIYYPALAVSRVPNVLPYTGGKLMLETLQFNFAPRLLFPDKPQIVSDSEMVRKYSGVFVAGEAQNTDIAFGYAAESYIDFGVPLMFIPVLIWGVFMGICYASILRYYRHRDIAVSIATVICWLSLYLFERSWAKTIGLGGTLIIYVGGLSFLLDRLWFEKFRATYAGQLTEGDEPVESAPLPLQFQPHSK